MIHHCMGITVLSCLLDLGEKSWSRPKLNISCTDFSWQKRVMSCRVRQLDGREVQGVGVEQVQGRDEAVDALQGPGRPGCPAIMLGRFGLAVSASASCRPG